MDPTKRLGHGDPAQHCLLPCCSSLIRPSSLSTHPSNYLSTCLPVSIATLLYCYSLQAAQTWLADLWPLDTFQPERKLWPFFFFLFFLFTCGTWGQWALLFHCNRPFTIFTGWLFSSDFKLRVGGWSLICVILLFLKTKWKKLCIKWKSDK